MGRADYRRRVIDVVRAHGIARARDFSSAGIPRIYLSRLKREGLLIQAGRGRYELAGTPPGALHAVAVAARIAPAATVCLLSALHVHGIVARPGQIWLLLPAKAWVPTGLGNEVCIVRASGPALAAGVEGIVVDGVRVPVTSVAKSVVDCFKYRSRVGTGVAVDALRRATAAGAVKREQLASHAAACRVSSVMRPYLDAVF